jgi:hypothetical protein
MATALGSGVTMPSRRSYFAGFLCPERSWCPLLDLLDAGELSRSERPDRAPRFYRPDRPAHGVRRRLKAHRAFYEEARGPIPDGMQLDHLCGNRACVNPDHLEPVSGVENVRRSRVAKLTVAAVAAIKASDEPAAVFAERFGVQRPAIHKIRAGRNWKDVAPNAETRTARPDSHSGRAA